MTIRSKTPFKNLIDPTLLIIMYVCTASALKTTLLWKYDENLLPHKNWLTNKKIYTHMQTSKAQLWNWHHHLLVPKPSNIWASVHLQLCTRKDPQPVQTIYVLFLSAFSQWPRWMKTFQHQGDQTVLKSHVQRCDWRLRQSCKQQ